MILKNVRIRKTLRPGDDPRCIYFESETGEDFYENLHRFTGKWVIGIDDQSIVRTYADTADKIYPAGLTVLDVSELPEDIDLDDSFKFDGKKVIKINRMIENG